ncbi:MAG: hypothetical protein MUF34_09700 [Polyangiaceae bacterium]|jgi:hypothetical protein|nr:hypothetical protein [Polyangiaceae bacterium]
MRVALAAVGLFGASASGACSASDCRVGYESNPLVPFRGGLRYAADGAPADEMAGGTRPPVYYETSTPAGEHLDFNGGARYCIYHGLGYRPFRVEPWVSFSSTGTTNGNEAKPAGNMLEVLHVDACVIIVRNDSCGEYYLRVAASDPILSELGAAPAACDGAAGDPCIDPDDTEQLRAAPA